MIKEENIGFLAERFLSKGLTEKEQLSIEQELALNPQLRKQWDETIALLKLLDERGKQKKIKALIKKASEKHHKAEKRRIAFSAPWLSTFAKLGIAAALVLASSLSTFLIMKNKTDKSGADYMLLRREIETIKHSHSRLIDSMQMQSKVDAEAPLYGGTGFAITNDGYIATNYHVVKDAKNIFVQTSSGESVKAYLIAFEPVSDVAILKTEDAEFKFSKAPIPYVFAKNKAGLGQSVFSIGYPQEDLIYNEGYISCENGFNGDTLSYQLEMTANPGQSGAPVLDKNGNVIALITGKQSNTTGKTFAVHSAALLDLIHSLPETFAIHVNTGNKLKGIDQPVQVSKIRDYICAIKVN